MIQLQVIPLDCTGCGRCCQTQGTPPFLDYERPFVPPDLLSEIDREIFNPGRDHDGPCLWYNQETKRCRHYDLRPDVCRDFVVGGEWCLDWREELLSESGRHSCVER
jgi:Fe-S-cluster containining protein